MKFNLLKVLSVLFLFTLVMSCDLGEEESKSSSGDSDASIRFWFDYTNASLTYNFALALDDEDGTVTDKNDTYNYTLVTEWTTLNNSEMSDFVDVEASSDYYAIVDTDDDGVVDWSMAVPEKISGGGSYTLKENTYGTVSVYDNNETTWGPRVRYVNNFSTFKYFAIGTSVTDYKDIVGYGNSVSANETSVAYKNIGSEGEFYITYTYQTYPSGHQTTYETPYTFEYGKFYTITVDEDGYSVEVK